MRMVAHGGKCCGVKHLYLGSYDNPETTLKEAEDTTPVPKNPYSVNVPPFPWECHIIKRKFPAQTARKRFIEMIKAYDAIFAYGTIEVTTSTVCSQTSNWTPLLEEYGFKNVGSCFNSNSNHRVTVWLRFKDKEEAPKKPQTKEAFA